MRIVPSGWEKEFAPRQAAPGKPRSSKLFSDVLDTAASRLSGARPTRGNGMGSISRASVGEERQVSAGSLAGRQFFGGAGTRVTPFDLQPSMAVEPAAPSAAPATTPGPFVPKFIDNVIVTSIFGGTWLLNPDYFATPETAQWMASKYGTGEVVEQTIYGFGNPYQPTTTTQANIKLANGTLVNAGLLACYYQTYPEAKFPGLADMFVRRAVAFVS
jgi:hypothetical protein